MCFKRRCLVVFVGVGRKQREWISNCGDKLVKRGGSQYCFAEKSAIYTYTNALIKKSCKSIKWPTRNKKKAMREDRGKVYEDLYQKLGIREGEKIVHKLPKIMTAKLET